MVKHIQSLIQSAVHQAQTGDLETAANLFKQCLTESSTLQERGLALGNLGIVQHWLGDYEQAITHHLEAIVLDEQANLGKKRGSDGSEFIPDYLWGEYTDARQVGSDSSKGYSYFNLGFAYYWQNDYANAIRAYEQSLTYAKASHDLINEVRVLAQLGEVYFYLADYTASLEYQQQVVRIVDELRTSIHPDLFDSKANALNSAGNALIKLGKWSQAKQSYEATLALVGKEGNPNIIGNALACIGIALANQSQYAQAIDCFESALTQIKTIPNRYNEGRLYSLIGQTYTFQGQSSQALSYQSKSLNISRELEDQFSEAVVLAEMGLTLLQLKRLDEAATFLKQAIELSEVLRAKLGTENELKISIFERQADPYQLLQLVLTTQHHYEAALEIAERGRARALIELLGDRATDDFLRVSMLTIKEIYQVARQQQITLVEYSLIQTKGLGQEYLLIWVITPKGHLHFHRVTLAEEFEPSRSLMTLVKATRNGVGVRATGKLNDLDDHRDLGPALIDSDQSSEIALNTSLKQFYRLLVYPIEEVLPKSPEQPIVFVPQSVLFLVPFAALMSLDDSYFIENHPYAVVPSVQTLILTQRQFQVASHFSSPSDALVIGNPAQAQVGFATDSSGYELSPLPGAESEARQIASLFNTEAIIGSGATKAVALARMPAAKIIHFAAHAFFDENQGSDSAIALAPADQDNGLLTAAEILPLSLQAELATLSACNTGRGRITGDGVIGLSRAFIAAGVPSVLVSLWAIPDISTASLMEQFYTQLQNGSTGKAQALRQAMVNMIRNHKHPREWAAFMLVGNWA